MSDRNFPHRFETNVDVNASSAELFAELDDHERLSAHMMRSSPMMAGNAMRFDFDEARGRAVGSRIRMSGRIVGFDLELEEVVTERAPPTRKVWETVGEPRLLIIGGYRMGFEIGERNGRSRLTMFIEYEDAPSPWALPGRLLAPIYARWCTESMAQGVKQRFE
jgi:hypothetical protein